MGSHSHAEDSADHSHADHDHDHGPSAVKVEDPCDCAGHRAKAAVAGGGAGIGWLSGVAPILACALCPVCLSAYATILPLLGVGFVLSEGQHQLFLIGAVVAAILAGSWRAKITRRFGPLGLTLSGCALLIFADLLHESRPLAVVGMVCLVAAMFWDRRAGKRAQA